MDQELTRQHYARLSTLFDALWSYSADFVTFLSEQIIAHLALTSDDHFVDLGCGTGIYAQRIAQIVQFLHPISCVDASAEMLTRLPATPLLTPVHLDALAFSSLPQRCDKILMKDVIHHIDKRETLFRQLHIMLHSRGRILLLMLPPTVEYPLFTEALARFEEQQPHYEAIAGQLAQAGFEVTIDEVAYPLAIPKDTYLSMINHRYMSVLSQFDDEALARGVNELASTYRDQSVLHFTDRFIAICGAKN